MHHDRRHFDPVSTLTDYAGRLNSIRWPAWRPKVVYDMMSGALVWSDETDVNMPVEVIWALRPIVAYRTCLMLSRPRGELASMWELGLSLFPKWVGFRRGRRRAAPKLLQIYRSGEVGLKKCLREIEKEVGRQNARPDVADLAE
jgi:hypothetical protein